MTESLSTVVVLLTAIGLGVWFPLRSVGGRVFLGTAAIAILLYLLHFVLRISLSSAAWTTLLVAAVGWVRLAWLIRRSGFSAPSLINSLINPALLLPTAFAVLLAIRGYDQYMPYSWDEFASWLSWTKEAFVVNGMHADGMDWLNETYTQGWPLALLYPQLLHADFDLARSMPVGLLWHTALLGLIYDAVRAHATRDADIPTVASHAGAWALILLLLAAEATWTLLPQLLLVETPQLFMIAGTLGFLFLGLAGTESRRLCTFSAGISLAAGYLTKVTVIGAIPAALIVVLMPVYRGSETWRPEDRAAWRRLVADLIALLLPVLAVYLSWRLVATLIPGCIADPFNVRLPTGMSNPGEYAADIAGRLLQGIGAYLSAFKLPLTIVSVFGIVVGLSARRLAPLSVAILVYDVVYVSALHPLYAYCYGEVERASLSSLSRYMRLPLRLTHLYGTICLVLWLIHLVRRLRPDGIRTLATRRPVHILLILVCVAGGLFQVKRTSELLTNTEIRSREPAETVSQIRSITRDTAALRQLVRRGTMMMPKVLLIAQGSEGFELRVALFEAIPGVRAGRRYDYEMLHQYSWGPTPENIWMHRASASELAELFRRVDVIWPFRLNAWVEGVLRDLPGAGDCAGNFTGHFLIRISADPIAYRCVPKYRERLVNRSHR